MKKVIATVAAMALPLAAHAAVYECDRTNKGSGGWVPPKTFLEINDAGTEAQAIDGIIKSVHDKPIPVAIKKKANGTYELSWKLRNVKTRNAGSTILAHTLTFDPAALTYKLRGRLHGSDNNISGRGTCKRIS